MKRVVFLLSFVAMLSSCGVYYPHLSDIPLVSAKHNVKIDAGLSLTQEAGISFSYGLTNRIAVQSYISKSHDNTHYLQIAPGLYKKLDRDKILELYMGYGSGSGYLYFDPHPGHFSGRYQLYFAQLDWGSANRESALVDFGFGLKAGLLCSKMLDDNYYAQVSSGTYRDKSLVLEPQAVLKIGGQHFRVSFKGGFCLLTKFTNLEKHFPYIPYNFGTGLNLNF
jgi:hypothetical protein